MKTFDKATFRASIIAYAGSIDLRKNFFELNTYELDELLKYKKAFGFSGKNHMGRSELRQFYYHLQKGFKRLGF